MASPSDTLAEKRKQFVSCTPFIPIPQKAHWSTKAIFGNLHKRDTQGNCYVGAALNSRVPDPSLVASGARMCCNLRWFVASGMRMCRKLRWIVASGARMCCNLRWFVVSVTRCVVIHDGAWPRERECVVIYNASPKAAPAFKLRARSPKRPAGRRNQFLAIFTQGTHKEIAMLEPPLIPGSPTFSEAFEPLR